MENLQDGAGVQLGKAQGQEKAAIPCWTGENLPFFLIGILVFITEKVYSCTQNAGSLCLQFV